MSNPIFEINRAYSPVPIYEVDEEDHTEDMVIDSPRLMPLCETEELPDDGFTLSVPKEGK